LKLAGRVSAAIEVLTEILDRKQPAAEALRDWGKAHRFAGSGDRHAIGTLVYDGLRNRLSSSFAFGEVTPRSIVLGVLKNVWKLPADDIRALAEEPHGPGALSQRDEEALQAATEEMPSNVAGDFPAWLTPAFQSIFGEALVAELSALAQRAPIDLRVNTLKAKRDDVIAGLVKFGAVAGPLSPLSVRIPALSFDQKHVNVEVEAAHGLGWFEVQDTASQIAALLTGAKPGETIADICSGAGGKTLALAAMMQNKGKLVAHDLDKRRLRPIFERALRAGASCIEVLAADETKKLEGFGGFDCVVIDAPCTGVGAWRRKPETKWKLTPKLLDLRLKDQREVLERGAGLVKKGGRLVYITCSILPDENSAQVEAFLLAHPDFKIIPYTDQWKKTIGTAPPISADGSPDTLLLTPHAHGTDGFFVAVMKKA
jgi:16S rRNA (cytosine967-C5)-methyltransferase